MISLQLPSITTSPQTRQWQGGCLCGHIRYQIEGDPLLAAICHCSMCRRAHAAPLVAWAMFSQSQVVFPRSSPSYYASSASAQRGFCPICGTQICFIEESLPDLIDIAIGSLDHPDTLPPTLHYWYSRHLSWAELGDSLPRYPEFPPFPDQ
ncbi:MAG: GFA family protein [Cyanobacteriota bacterium]|nr:GFA family protein [Cyanobacteriota bacterium]